MYIHKYVQYFQDEIHLFYHYLNQYNSYSVQRKWFESEKAITKTKDIVFFLKRQK